MDHTAPATVTFAEFRAHLAESIGRVRHGGDRLLLTTHGRPVAGVVSVEDLELLSQLSKPAPDTAEPPTVELSVVVAVGQDTAWNAWLDSLHRIRWWPILTFDPWLDGRLHEWVDGPDGRDIELSGRLVALEVGEWFTFTWDEKEWDGATTVTVRLRADGDRTHVTLTQSGWKSCDVAKAAEHRRRWSDLLDALVVEMERLSPGRAAAG